MKLCIDIFVFVLSQTTKEFSIDDGIKLKVCQLSYNSVVGSVFVLLNVTRVKILTWSSLTIDVSFFIYFITHKR